MFAVGGGWFIASAAMGAKPPGRNLAAPAALAAGIASLGVALAPSVPVAIAGLTIVGLAMGVHLTATIALLQRAEPKYLGRVMSFFGVVMIGSTPLGVPTAGILATEIGPRSPFVLAATAGLIAWAVSASAATPQRTPTFAAK